MNAPSLHEIKNLLQHQKYIDAILNQLKKDINDSDFDQLISKEIHRTPEFIQNTLTAYLINLSAQTTGNFFQLLYQIDIPESDFKACMSDNQIQFEWLSDLILQREFLKILLREKYSA